MCMQLIHKDHRHQILLQQCKPQDNVPQQARQCITGMHFQYTLHYRDASLRQDSRSSIGMPFCMPCSCALCARQWWLISFRERSSFCKDATVLFLGINDINTQEWQLSADVNVLEWQCLATTCRTSCLTSWIPFTPQTLTNLRLFRTQRMHYVRRILALPMPRNLSETLNVLHNYFTIILELCELQGFILIGLLLGEGMNQQHSNFKPPVTWINDCINQIGHKYEASHGIWKHTDRQTHTYNGWCVCGVRFIAYCPVW